MSCSIRTLIVCEADSRSIPIASLALTPQSPQHPPPPLPASALHTQTRAHTLVQRMTSAGPTTTKFNCRKTCVPKDFDESGFVLTTTGGKHRSAAACTCRGRQWWAGPGRAWPRSCAHHRHRVPPLLPPSPPPQLTPPSPPLLHNDRRTERRKRAPTSRTVSIRRRGQSQRIFISPELN